MIDHQILAQILGDGYAGDGISRPAWCFPPGSLGDRPESLDPASARLFGRHNTLSFGEAYLFPNG